MIERVQAYRVSTSTVPLYQSREALEETLQTRSASLRIYVSATRWPKGNFGSQEDRVAYLGATENG